MRLRAEEVLAATGGTPTGALPPSLVFPMVSTDTRTLSRGALFVALRGVTYDAHRFLDQAVARGAGAVVIEAGEEAPRDTPVIRVADTLLALGALGRWVRRKLGLRVLAVTGSVGKTTTKDLAAAVLREAGVPTLHTPGNWNNRVGLPLTLLAAAGDERAAVLELGINEPGEMDHLTAICEPDVAVITAVAEAHTEGLGDLSSVAREKLRVAAGLAPGGTLVLPHGDPHLTAPAGCPTVTFGWAPGADLRGSGFRGLGREGSRFRAGEVAVRLGLPGRHNAENALAALAGADALGVPWAGAVGALATASPGALRGEVRTTAGGANLLVDCYNANPRAVEAALGELAELAGPARKVAVLGEMRELGSLTEAAHARVGRAAARARVDELHLLGAAGEWTREAAAAAGLSPERIWSYQDRDALTVSLCRRVRPGDWVLLKGSRALGLEAVAEALFTWKAA